MGNAIIKNRSQPVPCPSPSPALLRAGACEIPLLFRQDPYCAISNVEVGFVSWDCPITLYRWNGCHRRSAAGISAGKPRRSARSLGLRIGLVTVPRLSPTVIRLCTATAYGLPAREQRCRGHRAKSDGVVDGPSSCTECSTPSFGPARADPAITQRARDRQLPSGHPVLHCFCAVRGPVNYSSPRGRSNGVLSYITIRPRRSLSRHGGR